MRVINDNRRGGNVLTSNNPKSLSRREYDAKRDAAAKIKAGEAGVSVTRPYRAQLAAYARGRQKINSVSIA